MKNTCMSSDYIPWFFHNSLQRTYVQSYSSNIKFLMKDRCGFLFVRYKRHCGTELVSWEHAACPLSGIKKRPLVGGWLNTSSIVISIGATASVRYREVVRSWEGPLWEVPLYIQLTCSCMYTNVPPRPSQTLPLSEILHSTWEGTTAGQ